MPEVSSSLNLANELRSLPEKERARLLAKLSDEDAHELLYDWELWARENQIEPEGLWVNWLILAGRGFGKTRCGAEQVRRWIKRGFNYVNFIGATSDDLRDIMIEGESGILSITPYDERPRYLAYKRQLVWPNGAVSLLFSAEEPERLRGKQHEKLWADEVASWQYAEEAWDQAMFGLRIGANPQAVVTTTPRPTKQVRALIADPNTVVTRGTTYENRENLAPAFYSKIIKKYEGSRLGRQELLAEVLDDNPGALFKLEDIEGARVQKLPPLTRIVVAMDPATTSTNESDEWGIVAAGQDGRDPSHFYILADESAIYTPDEAAKAGVRLYHRLGADRIIGEANNGGDMIETILRYQDANIAYKKITASRGKAIRAEPISALYQQRRVHHHGTFAKLEDQMVQWCPATDTDSPDRLDADVWALTELASGADSFQSYVRSEVGDMAKERLIAPLEASVNVDGSRHDRCECGSVAFKRTADGEFCFKCGAERAKDD